MRKPLSELSKKRKRIFLAGGSGFVGRTLAVRLRGARYDVIAPGSKQCDLTVLDNCVRATKGVDLIVHSAGIASSQRDQEKRPADIFYVNTLITLQLLEAAKRNGVKEVVLVGSIAGYAPRRLPQREEYILSNATPAISGKLGFYGLSRWLMVPAARAYAEQFGIKIRLVIFSNLYGPGDKFDDTIPPLVVNLIRGIHSAARAGNAQFNAGGNPGRGVDILYIDDACDLLMSVIQKSESEKFFIMNGGSGHSYKIKEVAEQIAEKTGFGGKIIWTDKNSSGSSSLDIRKARSYGWKPKVSLSDGIGRTVEWFTESYGKTK